MVYHGCFFGRVSTDQGSFTPHGLRDVDGTDAKQRQHDWSNPEDDNMLVGAPNNEELNSLSTFNTRHTPDVQHKTRDLHIVSNNNRTRHIITMHVRHKLYSVYMHAVLVSGEKAPWPRRRQALLIMPISGLW